MALKLRPDIHAAVVPAKSASLGSEFRHAQSTRHGSSANSVQQYSREPRRRQALPFSELLVSPAASASLNENGRWVSSFGIRGVLDILRRVVQAPTNDNPAL